VDRDLTYLEELGKNEVWERLLPTRVLRMRVKEYREMMASSERRTSRG